MLLDADPDARWGNGGESTCFYPTARLFRRAGDWADLIAQVAAELEKFAARHAKTGPRPLQGR